MELRKRLKEFILGRSGKVFLGFAFSVVTLYLSFRTISINQVRTILFETHWQWVILAVMIFIVNNYIKALRWKALLGAPGIKIGILPILSALLVSQMVNFVIPAKLGEVTRLQQIGVKGPGRTFVLGTVVVEKVVDMLAYAILFFVLLLSFPLPEWISGTGILFTLTAGLFVIILYGVIYHPEPIKKLLLHLLKKSPSKLGSNINSGMLRMLDSLEQVKDKKILLSILSTTIIIWFTSILVNLLLFRALMIPLGWQAAIVLLLALQAVISLPSVPGRIGVFEYVCILSLGLFEVEQATALSYGLLLHAVVLLPILVSGTILLATQKNTL